MRVWIYSLLLFVTSLIHNIALVISNFFGFEPNLLIEWYGSLLIWIFGNVKIYGHNMDLLQSRVGKTTLFTCNHVSYADWVLFFLIANAHGMMGNVRIVSKSIVKIIPGIGWSVWLSGFPVISKNWNDDEPILYERCCSYKTPVWLFIFPEGTFVNDCSDGRIDTTRKFCVDQGLPLLDYCLCPRKKGFDFLRKNLSQDTDVVDLTISYEHPYDTALPLNSITRTVPSITNFFKKPNISIVYVFAQTVSKADTIFDVFKRKESIMMQKNSTAYSLFDSPIRMWNYVLLGVWVYALYLIPLTHLLVLALLGMGGALVNYKMAT
jgi:1-acyl-sn-glycerol-3-phosphate acyltransferase